MDEEAIQKLAKEAVSIFLADWEDTSEAQMVEWNKEHLLVIKPASHSYATLHINLEEMCKRDLRGISQHGIKDTDSLNEHAKMFIGELPHVARNAPPLVRDFLYLLRMIAFKEQVNTLYGTLSEAMLEHSAESAGKFFALIQRRYGLTKKTRRGAPKVIDDAEAVAIIVALGEESPSQYKVAKALKTTPANVRNWLRGHGFKSPKELIDFLGRQLVPEIWNSKVGENIEEEGVGNN